MVLTAGIVMVLVVAALHASGWLRGSDATLEVMGFDPDRARLISALLAVALACALSVLAGGSLAATVLLGVAGFAALFGRTFLDETVAAVNASGSDGRFDPAGWVLSVVAFLVAAAVVSWAAATLVARVRSSAIDAGRTLVRWRRDQDPRRDLIAPLTALLAVVLVVVSLPVLGDMLNYAPDVRMRAAAALPPPLAGDGGGPVASDGALATPAGSPGPDGSQVTATLSKTRPWTAWRPTGTGTVTTVTLPAPWVGGTYSTATLEVYLPPGYGQGNRAYPTVYEVPWDIEPWSEAIHVQGLLDSLIDSASIPAEVVVFVSEKGGPFPDAECVNSHDGREWYERYLTDTVVPYVDSHFRTLPAAAARTLVGFSQGGYCGPMLLLRHPDLFASAIAFSGYYEAGIRDAAAPNAWRPFANDRALIAATSPLSIVQKVAPSLRRQLFVVLSANPNEVFYGPQYHAFVAVLQAAGVPTGLMPTNRGHAWAAVRGQLPTALQLVAAHQAAEGVFGT
jgi:enterochelin esterase-like enzyme